MPRYRKVDPRIWNDEKFGALSDTGKLAFLYILTHPNLTAIGAMRATLDGLAAELGWSPKRFRAALAPALRGGSMIEVNEQASYVGLPHFIKYNEPEGPNSVKAWRSAFDLIPECAEKRALVRRCRAYLDSKSPAFRDAMPDAIAEASGEPSPEPTPEPELRQEPEGPTTSTAASVMNSVLNGNGPSPSQVKALVELWNTSAPQECSRVRDLTEGRIRAVLGALRQQPSMEYWAAAIGELRQSSFLRGLNKRPGHEHWRATFDWFLQSKDKTPNYVRVAEGAYRDHAAMKDEDDE
jgi:hypothetical protein